MLLSMYGVPFGGYKNSRSWIHARARKPSFSTNQQKHGSSPEELCQRGQKGVDDPHLHQRPKKTKRRKADAHRGTSTMVNRQTRLEEIEASHSTRLFLQATIQALHKLGHWQKSIRNLHIQTMHLESTPRHPRNASPSSESNNMVIENRPGRRVQTTTRGDILFGGRRHCVYLVESPFWSIGRPE